MGVREKASQSGGSASALQRLRLSFGRLAAVPGWSPEFDEGVFDAGGYVDGDVVVVDGLPVDEGVDFDLFALLEGGFDVGVVLDVRELALAEVSVGVEALLEGLGGLA